MGFRTTHADALHQAGRRAEAEAHFREAEALQVERQPACPLLYSLAGFQYCDLLLEEAERAAWQHCVSLNSQPSTLNPLESCHAVEQRAAQTLRWAKQHLGLLDIALNQLTLGRAALYAAMLEGRASCPKPAAPRRGEDTAPYLATAHRELDAAVASLRRAGQQQDESEHVSPVTLSLACVDELQCAHPLWL